MVGALTVKCVTQEHFEVAHWHCAVVHDELGSGQSHESDHKRQSEKRWQWSLASTRQFIDGLRTHVEEVGVGGDDSNSQERGRHREDCQHLHHDDGAQTAMVNEPPMHPTAPHSLGEGTHTRLPDVSGDQDTTVEVG